MTKFDGGDESRVQALQQQLRDLGSENERLRASDPWQTYVRVEDYEWLREALVAIETDYGVEDPQLTAYIRSVLDA